MLLKWLPSIFQLDLNMSGQDIHNFIRGNDKVPGAWININGEVCVEGLLIPFPVSVELDVIFQQVTLYGSRLWDRTVPPRGTQVALDNCDRKATVWHEGLYIPGSDGGAVSVRQLQFESGKMIEASKFGQQEEEVEIEMTSEEQKFPAHIKVRYQFLLQSFSLI